MCDICMHSPCLSGCPNAPDPTPVTHCCSCGEPIIPGDEYGIIDGEAWCEDCLEDLPLCVLIGWLTFQKKHHLTRGVLLDKHLCKLYRLKRKEETENAEQDNLDGQIDP